MRANLKRYNKAVELITNLQHDMENITKFIDDHSRVQEIAGSAHGATAEFLREEKELSEADG